MPALATSAATEDQQRGDRVRARQTRDWLSEHPILGFVAVAYAISWTLWGAAALVGGVVGTIFLIAGAFGPAAAAMIMLRRQGGSIGQWLKAGLRWRVGRRFWLYALGLPPALYVVVNATLWAVGEPVELSLLPGRLVPYLATLVVVMLVGGGQEEWGWRGYALPRLEARHGPIKATLILGLVWGVWHVPIYGAVGFVVPFFLAFFFTWLYNHTGSVLLAIVLHGGFTASQDNLVLLAEETHGVTDAAMGIGYVVGLVTLLVATRGALGIGAFRRSSSAPARDRDLQRLEPASHAAPGEPRR